MLTVSQSYSEDLSPSMSDARLVEETRAGDQDAFRQLVLRYEKRLFRVIYRFVHDNSLAEDLSQETFLRVYENLAQFDVSRRFGPWLFRIGVNLTFDFLRKRKRTAWTSVFSEISPETPLNPGQSDPREKLDIREEVNRVIQDLPEKYRTILVLKDFEHFSTAEIAAIVNRKETTIRWRLAEARNRFKELWMRRVSQGPSDQESTPWDSNFSGRIED